MPQVPKLLSIGVVADSLGTTPARIAYLIRSRRIPPSALAGNTRLFTSRDMARLRHEINSIDARRSAKRAATESKGGAP